MHATIQNQIFLPDVMMIAKCYGQPNHDGQNAAFPNNACLWRGKKKLKIEMKTNSSK